MKKLRVIVHQWTTPEAETFPHELPSRQAGQVTEFLKRRAAGEPVGIIVTTSEMHVLRILRCIREEVDGVELSHDEVEFLFDSPGNPGELMQILPTQDGDLSANVPGGFFTFRAEELF